MQTPVCICVKSHEVLLMLVLTTLAIITMRFLQAHMPTKLHQEKPPLKFEPIRNHPEKHYKRHTLPGSAVTL